MNLELLPPRAVRVLRLSELDRLDPVTVFLEDRGNGRGLLVISCYGKAWSAYWGAMGSPLRQFVASVSPDYLLDRLDSSELTTLKQYRKTNADYLLRIVEAVQAGIRADLKRAKP